MTTGSFVAHLTLSALCLAACSKGSDPVLVPDARPADAAPAPDAPFIRVRACPTDDVALASAGDTNLHTRFYDSTFYLRTDQSLYHLRGTAQPAALITDGQSYPPGGAGAQIRLLPFHQLQIVVPVGYQTCPAFTPLAFFTSYLVSGTQRDLVVLVDDLTGDLTHVVGATDPYAGSQVSAVSPFAQSDCGDLAMQLSLTDGRRLLVRRAAATGVMKTLLHVASSGGVGGGAPIPGTTDRFFGFVNSVTFDGDQTLVHLSVDSGAPARLGMMLARIDGTTGAVTCEVTDTDVPCQLTSGSDTTGSLWSHAGDTVATAAGRIVRGGVAAPSVAAGSAVRVCRTGDVFLQRTEQNSPEIFVIRRDNRVERVTRFRELERSGEPTVNYIQGFVLGPGCELVIAAGDTRNQTFGSWIYWPDGTLGKLAPSYRIAGFEANGNAGLHTEAGAHAIARKPADCIVPPPQ